ncbi:MAG TPA: hypothetical protein VEO54_29415 [Thermoanaerobaculia bacterium]|nr:hypothetical protein [Thermoanaerobaculia bacterium]
MKKKGTPRCSVPSFVAAWRAGYVIVFSFFGWTAGDFCPAATTFGASTVTARIR